MDKQRVLQQMMTSGVIPMFSHSDPEVCKRVIEACINGGCTAVEFTIRRPFAVELYAALMKFVRLEFPDVAFGAGSIVDAGDASVVLQMGADFVVTPVLREDVARVCNRRRVLWSPGCGSANEIAKAEELGCDVIKLFPADVYGPGFVKSLLGPAPWTQIMVTGGIAPDEQGLRPWFDAGVACVGMGSKLVRPDLLASKNYGAISSLARQAVDLIHTFRT